MCRRRPRTARTRSHSADPAIAEGILTAAGFAEISFTDVREPVY